MGGCNIPEHLVRYFTFVQADGFFKNIWNLTTAFILLLGFGLRADVFQNPQLLKYVYVLHHLNRTKIHTTKKLEKLVKKLISTDQSSDSGKLGKWNANLFYVDRKKCWLFTNGRTKYNVILADIKAADLKNIESIFKESFYGQLIYDGIITDFEKVDSIIGRLNFLPTDNDRKTTGFQNHRLQELNWWTYEFEGLENMPIKDLTNRMNDTPIHVGNGRKMYDYTDSIQEKKKILME